MLICLAFNTNVVEGLNSSSKFTLITPNSSLTINQNEDLELLCEFNEKLTNDGMTQIEYVEWHFIPKRDNQKVIPYSYGILQKNTEVKRNFSVKFSSDRQTGVKIIIPSVNVCDSGIYKCSINEDSEIMLNTVNVKQKSGNNSLINCEKTNTAALIMTNSANHIGVHIFHIFYTLLYSFYIHILKYI